MELGDAHQRAVVDRHDIRRARSFIDQRDLAEKVARLQLCEIEVLALAPMLHLRPARRENEHAVALVILFHDTLTGLYKNRFDQIEECDQFVVGEFREQAHFFKLFDCLLLDCSWVISADFSVAHSDAA